MDMVGLYHVEQWREDKLIAIRKGFNAITKEGKLTLLNQYFHTGSTTADWYIDVFLSSYTEDTDHNLGDLSAHTFNTNYSEGARLIWPDVTAVEVPATNTMDITTISPGFVSFSITGDGTLGGIFITDSSVKTDFTFATFLLWATASFSSSLPVLEFDTLKITYTVKIVL